MKQIVMKIMKGGQVKILTDSTFGPGTEEFTKKLGEDLGEIKERHQGVHHVSNEIHTHQGLHQH
jgi:hypothetical protein